MISDETFKEMREARYDKEEARQNVGVAEM